MEYSRGKRKPTKKPGNNRRSESKNNDKFQGPERDLKYGKPSVKKSSLKKVDHSVRLNKYIAHAGICSRREADNFIQAGVITVNGEPINELGYKVKPGDVVRFNGERLNTEKKVYILLNKPKDVTTTLEDKHAERTVIDLVANACNERVYPVGRLDKKTTGVLLLTNDGELTAKLTHPKYNRKKIYHVQLDKNLAGSDFEKIMNGLELEDGPIKPDEMSFINPGDLKQLGIEIHSGRNRIVRRIFEHVGYKVVKLDRVYFAGLTKRGMPRGKWRFLTDKEINFLKMS